jgi:hypothetical protein
MDPADEVLNDSTNDFQSRAALVSALDHANPDSQPGVGYDPSKGRGWRHETGGTVWQLPAGGGFLFVEEDDPNATECTYHYTADPVPPVPGAIKQGNFHVHPYKQKDSVYGCDSVKTNRGYVKARKYPGDPNAHYTPTAGIDDFHGGGSDDDWQFVQRKQKPNYVINKWGNAYVLSYHGSNRPIYPNPKRYFARGSFAGKCTWAPSL